MKTKLQVQIKKKAPDSTPTPTSSTFLPEKKLDGPAVPLVSPDHQHYHGTIDAITKILHHEGLSGLYAGMAGSLLGVASTNFAYFYWYTAVRTLWLSYQPPNASHPGTAVELSLGAVAGALAQLFTLPVAVATTRQQTVHKNERKGLIATGREIVEGEDGWPGLWRGLKASLVLVINPAITYGAYQRLKDVLFPEVKQLAPWQAFSKSLPSRLFATANGHLEAVKLTSNSSRLNVEDARHHRNTTAHRGQGRSPVKTSSSARGQAIQELHRGYGVHRRTRGCSQLVQRHWSANIERIPRTRLFDDDEGEVCLTIATELECCLLT